MAKELLGMERITRIYDSGFMASRDISSSVNTGKIHASIGENGAGKTMLTKILFGLGNCQEGKILIRREERHITNPLDAVTKGIGMVHQHFVLVPNSTVAENIVFGIEPGHGQIFNRKQAIQMMKEVSEKHQPAVGPSALVRDLSMGLKQKVELLRALIRSVEVLILDEPTAALVPQETRDLFRQLKVLREHDCGIIFISHKLEEVMELYDSTTVLHYDRVSETVARADMGEVKLSRLIIGRDVVSEMERDKADCRETVPKVRSFSYVDSVEKYPMKDVSFDIRVGEVVGIVSVEGNGQTELSEMITGLLPIVGGGVEISDSTIKGLGIRKIRDSGLAHISEDRMTYGCAPDLSVYNSLASIYLGNQSFIKGLFVNEKMVSEYVGGCIKEFETARGSEASLMRILSGGNTQKVTVAKEFIGEANLVIANQPTRGTDVETVALVHKLLHRYVREGKPAALLTSSDSNEVLNLSDRLSVMRGGEFGAQFTNTPKVTDEILGEYMLGIREMTSEGRGELY